MASELVRWVYGLTVVFILGSILLRAMPKGIHQKFLRFFFGIILLLAVFSPVFDLLGISARAAADYESLLDSLEQSLKSADDLEEWQNASVYRREASMQEPLQTLVGEYGYELLQADMDWNEEGTELVGITLALRKSVSSGQEKQNLKEWDQERADQTVSGSDISQVEEIRSVDPIGENSENSEKAEEAGSTGDLQDLREVIQSLFSLPQSQIRLIVR